LFVRHTPRTPPRPTLFPYTTLFRSEGRTHSGSAPPSRPATARGRHVPAEVGTPSPPGVGSGSRMSLRSWTARRARPAGQRWLVGTKPRGLARGPLLWTTLPRRPRRATLAPMRLRPGVRVLWRAPGEVQVGTDPRWALRLTGLLPAEERALGAL